MAAPISASLVALANALSDTFDDCDAVRVAWRGRGGWREVLVTSKAIKGYVRPYCGNVTRFTLPADADWGSDQAHEWVRQVAE